MDAHLSHGQFPASPPLKNHHCFYSLFGVVNPIAEPSDGSRSIGREQILSAEGQCYLLYNPAGVPRRRVTNFPSFPSISSIATQHPVRPDALAGGVQSLVSGFLHSLAFASLGLWGYTLWWAFVR